MSIFRSLEYRWGVLGQYIVDFVWYVIQFALLRTAYNYVPQIGAYGLQEVYLFLAIMFLNDAVNMLFFSGGIEHFTRQIRLGGLDHYLLKPMPTLYQLTVARVNLSGLLNLFMTIGFWLYVFGHFPIDYPTSRWLWAAALFINGLAINVAVRFIISCLAFWTVEGGTLNWLFHEVLRFGQKPEAVYGGIVRRILTSAVPILLLTPWPCMVLIRETTLWERTFPFLVGAGSLGALALVWIRGIRRYEGLSFN
jgi:ABC-type uncharacterized transport system permease subunit